MLIQISPLDAVRADKIISIGVVQISPGIYSVRVQLDGVQPVFMEFTGEDNANTKCLKLIEQLKEECA